MGAVRVVFCGCDPPAARLGVLIEARLLPAALVELWLMRTTVVEALAVPVPWLASVQLAVTKPLELTTDPFKTCRSGVVEGGVPVPLKVTEFVPVKIALLVTVAAPV